MITQNELTEITKLVTIDNNIDSVISQLRKEFKGCKISNYDLIARKYNLPIGSKVAVLITMILDNERVL